MKQVKKLLVILPLVALFVLGSLPVLAAQGDIEKYQYNGEKIELDTDKKGTITGKPGETFDKDKFDLINSDGKSVKGLYEILVSMTEGSNDRTIIVKDFEQTGASGTAITQGEVKATITFKSQEEKEKPATEKSYNIIAFNIHNNKFVYDRLFTLDIKNGWWSEKDVSEAFYKNSETLAEKYLYAGFATKTIKPVLIYRATYLERIAESAYMDALDKYKADIVVFVVPRTIKIETIHVFPEGTRSNLTEIVSVPYEVWASLQHSWTFMNLPDIFKTRIQKINEQGYTFREVKYYNGENEITGLLAGYDWFNIQIRDEDGDDDFCARIFYDKAVAAAKEVPTEKKVDAATAPQAQIQAPAAQAPVTAANTTTTTAPVNTLPVTGASDSIFLFLSSAALMAVGILFFKKH